MSLRQYDERVMMVRLARLDRDAKTAFAASCAQQLLPFFERYARSISAPELAKKLEAIVAATWAVAGGMGTDISGLQTEAESMVPAEEDDWPLDAGYAQNAAAAAAYAVRTWLTDDPQEAAWAARQVYELADYMVLQSDPSLDLNMPRNEAQVLGSDTVQRALAALDSALFTVESSPPTWQELRDGAEAKGATWVGKLQ